MTGDPTPPAIGPGLTVGHYAILSNLGQGGMGEVYLAYDTKLDRKVAVKVLPAEFASDTRRLRRFEVEAKALAALNHPNIVSVFSIEESAGRHLLVMELVEGRTLRELIQPPGMPVSQFLEIAVSLADAIGAAHARGVMHRDLKPENIMITTSGWVKILDFGLAKFRTDEARIASADTKLATNITVDGMAMGTVPYMSPEQLEGEAIDHRSDIFSLGVVFHEMLTGEQPFRGRTVAQLVSAILRDDPPPLGAARADLPQDCADILTRCLSKRPDGRFTSAVALHRDLRLLQRRMDSGQAVAAVAAPPSSDPASHPLAMGMSRAAPSGVDLDSDGGTGTWTWLDSRWGVTALIAGLWMVNWIETSAEELWSVRTGSWLGYDFAQAFSWFERGLSFERHDLSGPVAVYAGSIAYFFVPVLLLAFTLAALVPRKTRDGYRIVAFAMAVCYGLSLPFYLLLPVPERWAFPDAQAILLSDLWSATLIETIRPISGLDNCFPSFHVSGTFALVLVWYVLRLRFRHAIAWLAAAVTLSTFLLGIHWIADIVAGLGLALISVRAALWMNERVRPCRVSSSVYAPHD
jgi:serine/threonine protein kinase